MTQMSINGQMGKQTVVYTYNGLFSNKSVCELLTHTTTWTNVKVIMQNERNQTKKSMYCKIPIP